MDCQALRPRRSERSEESPVNQGDPSLQASQDDVQCRNGS